MMDALKKLQARYKLSIPADPPDPPRPEIEVKQPDRPAVLNSWRDSTSVTTLSVFLKECLDITLATRDGLPVLVFDPPIELSDYKNKSSALIQACTATELLMAAGNDLKFLLSKGLIKLPSIDPVKPNPDRPRNPRPEKKFKHKKINNGSS